MTRLSCLVHIDTPIKQYWRQRSFLILNVHQNVFQTNDNKIKPFEPCNDTAIFETRLGKFVRCWHNRKRSPIENRTAIFSNWRSSQNIVQLVRFERSACSLVRHTYRFVNPTLHKPVKSYFAVRHAFYNAKQRPPTWRVCGWMGNNDKESSATKCVFQQDWKLQLVIWLVWIRTLSEFCIERIRRRRFKNKHHVFAF